MLEDPRDFRSREPQEKVPTQEGNVTLDHGEPKLGNDFFQELTSTVRMLAEKNANMAARSETRTSRSRTPRRRTHLAL
jgi:hypothetical protein